MKHLENMNKIILATGTMVGYAYAMEFFIAWYSRQPVRALRRSSTARSARTAWAYWMMVTCNVISPQLFWFKKLPHQHPGDVRRSSIFVNIGMWFERFVIIVTSLHRDFLPSRWGYFQPDLGRHLHASSARSACSSRCSCCSSACSR